MSDSRPVLIQSAVAHEVAHLIELTQVIKKETIHGTQFTHGLLCGIPVIINSTRVGFANAATVTTLAAMTYSPRAIINQGTAGAHSLALHTGDLVIGRRLVHIGSYVSDARARGEGVDANGWRKLTVDLPSDGGFAQGTELFAPPELLALALDVAVSFTFPHRILAGSIGSGDVWNREYDMIDMLNRTLSTDCEEMESFASALACGVFGIPHLAVRAISNNERLGEPFDPSVCAGLNDFVASLVQRL